MKRARRPPAPPLLADLDLARSSDPVVRRTVEQLLNVVEELAQQNADLRAEVQALRDEVARLKGEQGKPVIRPAKSPAAPPAPYSSEAERHTPKPWTKAKKLALLPVDRDEVCTVD